MQLSTALIPYMGLAALLTFPLVWYLERERRRTYGSFRNSSQVLALGLPAVTGNAGDGTVEHQKVISEFRKIGDDFRRHQRAIEAARTDFYLSNGIQFDGSDGQSRFIPHPSRFLACDVILGDSLASVDLTPGSTIYWQRIPGSGIDQAVKSDSSIVADLIAGRSRTIAITDFEIELNLDYVRLLDRRSDSLGEVKLERGKPMLLSLDEESQQALEEAFGADAPAKGTSRKVRLFGGLQVDGTGKGLQVIPYRQQPGMKVAARGRVHPLAGLLGVVVGEEKDKAFRWSPPKSDPVAIPSLQAAPEALAAFQTVR